MSDEMETFHQDTACKTLRACGLPRRLTLQVLNTIQKWKESCGDEWTVGRLKELHLWYIRRKAGDHEYAPSWHAHSKKDSTPKGVWGYVFRLRNEVLADAVLSIHTSFKLRSKGRTEPLPSQKKKFLDAVLTKSIGYQPDPWWIQVRGYESNLTGGLPRFRPSLPAKPLTLSLPGIEIVTGSSIPRRLGSPSRLATGKDRLDAYIDSWLTLPKETVKFLAATQEGRGYLPKDHLEKLKYGLPSGDEYVGSIACIQEPSLKARWVANPNRITQHFLSPIGDLWYSTLRGLPSDCTFRQEAGIQWAQQKLKSGRTLVGFDLSSATDRLELFSCIDAVNSEYFDIPPLSADDRKSIAGQHARYPQVNTYLTHLDHFVAVSRGKWYGGGVGIPDVSWAQGQPLGTYPSFALLGLAHNAIGIKCCRKRQVDPNDSFRIVGDDIIMDEKIADTYLDAIERMGGIINHSKSLTSSTMCEFAGRLIRKELSYRKNFKYLDPGDNSFMEVVSYLGPQAAGVLRPRQRQVYEQFKFVPGVIVDGGFPRDSFGEPLSLRYQWYLMRSQLLNEELTRDETKTSPQMFAEVTRLRVQEVGDMRSDHQGRLMTAFKVQNLMPFSNPTLWDDPHPILADLSTYVPPKKDPRLVGGLTFLDRGEAAMRHPSFMDYISYRNQLSDTTLVQSDNPAGTETLVRGPSPKSKDLGR